MTPFRLETSRLILRLATEADAPEIVRYVAENRARFEPTDPPRPAAFYTEKFWRGKALEANEEWHSERAIRLFLIDRADDRTVVGTASFTQLFRGPFQACYLGYGIGGAHEGKGLMREALEAAIAHAFGELDYHRIMANHLPENERSARLLARLGFEREGLARDYLWIGGRWRDHVLNALTNKQWRGPIS